MLGYRGVQLPPPMIKKGDILLGIIFGSSYININPGKFHLCSSFVAAFYTSKVLCSIWQINQSGLKVFGLKDDDIQA